MPDPVAELRTAAEALTAEPTSALHHHVGAWLSSVADRMVLGGWVGTPERNRALKVARTVDRCPSVDDQGQGRCSLPAGHDPDAEPGSLYAAHELHDPQYPSLVRLFSHPARPQIDPIRILGAEAT